MGPIAISVIEGENVNAGMLTQLEQFTLGSSVNCDVVLDDPDLAKEHLLIKRNGSESILLESKSNLFSMPPSAKPTPNGFEVPLPCKIRLANTMLEFSLPDLKGSNDNTRPDSNDGYLQNSRRNYIPGQNISPFALGVLSMMIGLAIITYQLFVPNVDLADQSSAGNADMPIFSTLDTPAIPAQQIEQVTETFREHLDAENFDSIGLTVEDGLTVAYGIIPDTDEAKWINSIEWFESNYGLVAELSNEVELRSQSVILAEIGSVGFFPEARIRTRSGRVVRLGDTLVDDWKVESVVNGVISLTKSERLIKVDLAK